MSRTKSTVRRTSGVELTDLAIQKIRADKIILVADRSSTPDGKVRRGLLLKVTPTGTRTFVYRYDTPTGKNKITLGSYPALPLANARHMVDDLRQSGLQPADFLAANGPRYMKGYDPTTAPPPVDVESNTHWVKRYLVEVSETNRGWAEQKRILEKYFLPTFGKLTPLDVSEELLLVPINQLARAGKLRAAATVRDEVRGYFNWLRGEKRTRDEVARGAQITIGGSKPKLPGLPPNPAKGIAFPKVAQRSYTLEAEELPGFMLSLSQSAMRDGIKALLLTQLETFARVSEVAGMPWDELDLKKGVWTIPPSRAKNGQQHVVQLATQTIARLKGIGAAQKAAGYNGLYVFPRPSPRLTLDAPERNTAIANAINRERMSELGPTGKPVRRTRRVAGKLVQVGTLDVHPDFTTHSLRHTAVEWAREAGVPVEVREKLTNHKRDLSDMSQRYGKGELKGACAEALQNFANYLEALS